MAASPSLAERLKSVPPTPFATKLVRLVPYLDLARLDPVNWLYSSGKANRYNPAGIEALYAAVEESTARAEYDDGWSGLPGRDQPFVTYSIETRLTSILDLTSSENLRLLDIAPRDLFKSWRTSRLLTITQRVGEAVAMGGRFSAILYPSRAARDAGIDGNNLVIFRGAVKRADSVRIIGTPKKILQKWPTTSSKVRPNGPH